MPTQPALRLYRFPLSGHCHRVELLLSLADISCELVDVDLAAKAHKTPEFLAKNAFGQVPVLQVGAWTLADSNAILVYLAERYPSARRFWPAAPEERAAVQRWLSVAAGPLARGPAAARLVHVFGASLDYASAVSQAEQLFTLLEAELTQRTFLVGTTATLADIAMYTYTAHAPEGGIGLEAYPALGAWLRRIEALPGFVAMTPAPRRNT